MNVVERYSKNVEDEPGLEVVTYWTNGIIVRLGEAKSERSEKGFMEYIPDEFVLKLHVRTKSESSKCVSPTAHTHRTRTRRHKFTSGWPADC